MDEEKLLCEEVQFDEMESFEHTRLKPLSIALAVSGDGKRILDAQVGVLHYKGPLASLAMRKYGPRIDTSREARARTLKSIERVVSKKGALNVITDAKPQYRSELDYMFQGKLIFNHVTVSNEDNQVRHATNPTLRKNVGDLMFWLNHIAARIRHDLSRMMRKVWTTTKILERLQAHLNLFIAYYNDYQLSF